MSDKPESRELTREERREIRRLVTNMCANYDSEYGWSALPSALEPCADSKTRLLAMHPGCLPLDCGCYMLGKWWTGSYCKYFREAVLPLNPTLESALMRVDTSQLEKKCPVCGAFYIPVTSQAYCTEACTAKGRLETYRKYNRKRKRK